ncbi:MAG: TIR domain-containing protein [Hyphomonadaceae bacterium]
MGDQGQAAAAERKLRVFLSYSRKDAAYVERLAQALTERGFLADFDRSTHDKDNVEVGISAEDEWWQRLQDMILAADVMVFLVSPDSASSRVCDEEIAYARATGKRVIAILRRPIDFNAAPPRLAALNVKIDATADDDAGFAENVGVLATALDRDVAWLREQTRMQQAANDWSRSGERDEELLRGAEIAEAEAWLARKPPNVTELSESLVAFLNASRLGQAQRDERERQALARQRRLQTWVGGLVAVALVITLAGGAFVIDRQRNVARSQSLTLARSVELYLQRNDFAGALRLAVLASRNTFLSPASEEARVALASASAASPLIANFVGHEGEITGAALSPDERLVLSWSRDGATRIWDAATGALLRTHENGAEVNGARFFANGERVVSWDSNGGVHIFSVAGDPAADPPPMDFEAAVYNVGMTPDESLIFIAVGSGANEDYGRRQLVVRRVSDGAAHGEPIPSREMIGGFSFTPDGRRVLVRSLEFAQIYDVATLQPVGAQMRHNGQIYGGTFSPDGARVLTYSSAMMGSTATDNAARLWDAATGAQIGAPLQHSGVVRNARFTPDSQRIVTLSRDATVRVWDGRTGAPLTPPLSHAGPINAETPDDQWTVLNRGVYDADFSPDGRLLATTGSDQRLRVWRLDQGGAPLFAARTPAWANFARFSADGSRIFTLDQGGELRAWDVVTGLSTDLPIPGSAVWSGFVLSEDRLRALTWSNSATLSLWNLDANRARSPRMGHDAIVSDAQWLGGGEIMSRSVDGQVRIWNAENSAQIGSPIVHVDVLDAAVSPDQTRLMTWGIDGAVRQWARGSHAPAGAAFNVGESVVHAVYVGDGARIATIDWGKTLRLWDANSGAQIGAGVQLPANIPQLHAANVSRGPNYNLLLMFGIQRSPDGRRLVSWANADAAVQMDAETGAAIGAPMTHADVVTGATYAHDGAKIATWSGQTAIIGAEGEDSVRLWNADGAPLGEPLAHDSAVRGAAFSPDDAQLVSWTEEGQVVVWDVASRTAALTLQHVERRPNGNTGFVVGAGFTPDAGQIVSWGDDGVKFWDRETGAQIGLAMAPDSTITSASFSPDGRYLLTMEQTNAASAKIKIWDVETHLLLTAQGEGAGILYGVQWRPDGQAVLSWGESRAPQIWLQPWMSHSDNLNTWAREVCDAQLRGDAMERQLPEGVNWVGVRRISQEDAALAPILRGREGEDVCAWRPKWYDRVLDFLFGWMG